VDDKTIIPLSFAESQSFFIVFRNKLKTGQKSAKRNFPSYTEVVVEKGAWMVQFDPAWGGPKDPVQFTSLTDWTAHADNGIKYFSGTAVYKKIIDYPADQLKNITYLDLGTVNHIARVILNNRDLGVVWTAPWMIKVPAGLLLPINNSLVIEVTNVWANRLIGDEQEPADCEWLPGHISGGYSLKEFPDWFLKNQARPSAGRLCFTTWNYFNRDSPLVPSGLLGPVRFLREVY
jgi:hypothetical protein